MTHSEITSTLDRIPVWHQKIDFFKNYTYNNGAWFLKENTLDDPYNDPQPSIYKKIHYGCGGNIIEGWLNIDLHEADTPGYQSVNLLERHPFRNDSVQFGFSEDMLEHLTQAQSIFFLSEIYRTLEQDGVMRLSFPGLEGVLQRHYTPPTEERVRTGELEAYTFWGHVHFYSKDELTVVAKHLGFRNIEFHEFCMSNYKALSGLETRHTQSNLNIYAELTK